MGLKIIIKTELRERKSGFNLLLNKIFSVSAVHFIIYLVFMTSLLSCGVVKEEEQSVVVSCNVIPGNGATIASQIVLTPATSLLYSTDNSLTISGA